MKNASSANGVTSRFFGSTMPSNVPSRRPVSIPQAEEDLVEKNAMENAVRQEIGYRSPTAGCSELGEVSSPSLSPKGYRKAQIPLSDIEDVSSPVLYRHTRNRNASPEYVESGNDEGDASDTPKQLGVPPRGDTARRRSQGSVKKISPTVLVHDTPPKVTPKAVTNWGPNLADLFTPNVSDRSSVIGDFDVPSPSPVKSRTNCQPKGNLVSDDEVFLLHGEEEARARLLSTQNKWRATWSNPAVPLKRKVRNTSLTRPQLFLTSRLFF
jgi:hypothetical protein